MPTLMQKIRLTLRVWNRRREESEKEFLARNTSWGVAQQPAPAATASVQRRAGFDVDMEGLTVAFLDDSGQLAHFLDVEDGDIIDLRIAELSSRPELQQPRYKRIPTRDAESEAADRTAFVASLDPSPARDTLVRSSGARDSFRSAVASDRTIERGWFNFKNDRAIAAIETWLKNVM